MANPHTPIARLLNPLLQSFRTLSFSSSAYTTPNTSFLNRSQATSAFQASPSGSSRHLSTTPAAFARGGNPKAKGNQKNQKDPRITLIRYHLQHPLTPRPLRLSRMRALRHWTIHRAWMLARRKRLEEEELELQRQYQSMHAANEALRNLDSPGMKDAGRLYRIATEKKGIFGKAGVPIEYARAQVDTPGAQAWNHAWTR